ncbi:MAG: dUTP diphosphatase [Micrococcales bacterium]
MVKKLPVLIVADEEFKPTYAHPGDAGADLRSRVETIVPAGLRVTCPTGVSVAIPAGFVGLVHSRSGLAAKSGISVLNSPGTIDAGYRGEIAVTLQNHSTEDFKVSVGDRIAQIIFQQVEVAEFITVERLPESHRSNAGFGSTGLK